MITGLLQKATNAKQANEETEICEQLKLVYAEYQIGHYSTEVDVEERLKEIYGDDVSDVYFENGNKKLVARVYKILYQYDSLTGIAGKKKPVIGELVTKSNYGDYIDLGQSVVGNGNSTIDDWRILYNDTKDKVVYAILADYLPNNNLAVISSGLNKVNGKTYNVNSMTSRQDLFDKLNNTMAWQSLIPEGLKNICQVQGATTVEIIMASYNDKYGTDLDYTSFPYLYVDADTLKGIDTLYMPHPDANRSGYRGCYAYWLSSPYNQDLNMVLEVYCNGGIGRERYDDIYRGIRPVVAISSDIKVTSSTSNGKTIWTIVQ